MENKEKINPEVNKVIDTLAKELESLNAEELHEFFKFFYKMNHNQANMISPDSFEEFLEAFDVNPFKNGDDKRFRKQLIDNIIKYAFDHMSLIMMALAEQQIKAAFEQSEKEVTDLHSRISQGMREAKKNGVKIGLPQGTTLTTKKALECMAIIKKHSKDFGGSLEDPDVIKLCGCSRNSYYKYKKEAKSN